MKVLPYLGAVIAAAGTLYVACVKTSHTQLRIDMAQDALAFLTKALSKRNPDSADYKQLTAEIAEKSENLTKLDSDKSVYTNLAIISGIALAAILIYSFKKGPCRCYVGANAQERMMNFMRENNEA